jgi:hypothetical protein
LVWRPISLTPPLAPLNENAMLRETIDNAETLPRSVMMSSVIPSEKYSCSGSPLMLANGSTQIATSGFFSTVAAGAAGLRGGAPSFASSALRSPWNAALCRSSPQPSRSVVWTARKSIGIFAASNRTGTSTPRSAASRASPRTQRESTDAGVQTTISARDASSSREISASNSSPGVISGSHHTDQPSVSRAATSGATRALSDREYETNMSANGCSPR